MNIGEKIKSLRLDAKMTQSQLARLLDIDRSNLSKYELGKLEVNNDMLIKLSKIFEVSTDYLLGLKDI